MTTITPGDILWYVPPRAVHNETLGLTVSTALCARVEAVDDTHALMATGDRVPLADLSPTIPCRAHQRRRERDAQA